MRIRIEHADDAIAIRRVHTQAFPSMGEANLVDHLRANDHLLISLVAECISEETSDGNIACDGVNLPKPCIAGHIAFSPVFCDGQASNGLGLAPVAVLPDQQGTGIGSRLIKEGIEHAKSGGFDFLVVLGEPDYYSRFGFMTAGDLGWENEYGATDAFMGLKLNNAIEINGGLITYGEEFRQL